MTAAPPSSGNPLVAFVCRYRRWLLGLVAAVAAADVLWLASTYLAYPGYVDHGEPVVAITAWRVLEGFPAYPAFDGPDRTSNLYGPVTYLIHGLVYLLAGSGIPASKVAGLAATVLTLAVVFLAHRRDGPAPALGAAVLAAGFVLTAVPASLWNRPDPFLALLVAVAVWAMRGSAAGQPAWGKGLAIGIAGGLAVGLKAHAGIYFVPVALYYCWDRGLRAYLAVGAAGAITILAPFAADLFSLANYVSWFPMMAAKPVDVVLLTKVVRYSAFYLAPAVFFAARLAWADAVPRRAEAVYFGSFVACVFVLFALASKPGAGWHYFFPFLAVAVDLVVRHYRAVTRHRDVVTGVATCVAAALLVVSVPIQKRFQQALHWEDARAVTAEIGAIMAAYPDKRIQMGVGDSLAGYRKTLYKPLLVFAGHPYTLDVGIMIELSKLGIGLSEAALRRIDACYTEVWLVPKGERPFELVGYYGNPVFDGAFRSVFTRRHKKDKSFNTFDAWVCNP